MVPELYKYDRIVEPPAHIGTFGLGRGNDEIYNSVIVRKIFTAEKMYQDYKRNSREFIPDADRRLFEKYIEHYERYRKAMIIMLSRFIGRNPGLLKGSEERLPSPHVFSYEEFIREVEKYIDLSASKSLWS